MGAGCIGPGIVQRLKACAPLGNVGKGIEQIPRASGQSIRRWFTGSARTAAPLGGARGAGVRVAWASSIGTRVPELGPWHYGIARLAFGNRILLAGLEFASSRHLWKVRLEAPAHARGFIFSCNWVLLPEQFPVPNDQYGKREDGNARPVPATECVLTHGKLLLSWREDYTPARPFPVFDLGQCSWPPIAAGPPI
jgi:hypothetical protein